jgi:hypothetical protein
VAQHATGSEQNPTANESHPAAPSKRATITLPRRTDVHFLGLETVSSATAQVGQQVRLAVSEDVVVDGIVVIPKGTPVSGVVTWVRKAIPGKRNGGVGVEPVSLALPDGSQVPLREGTWTDPEAEGLSGVILSIAALPFVFSDMAKERHRAPEPGNDEMLPLCWQWFGNTMKKARISLAIPAQPWSLHPTGDVDSVCPAGARPLSIYPLVPQPQ